MFIWSAGHQRGHCDFTNNRHISLKMRAFSGKCACFPFLAEQKISMKREEFERVKGIFTAEFVSSNLISENAAFHKHPNKKRPRDATVVCIKSLHIHKGPLALASKDFGKHFKLHCCLIGGEHCNGNASRVAIVRVPWFDGEWTAANICACIRFKTFEEASRAIQEVCYFVLLLTSSSLATGSRGPGAELQSFVLCRRRMRQAG